MTSANPMTPNRFLLKFASRHPVLIVWTVVLGFSGAIFNGISATLIVPVILGFLGQTIDLSGMPPVIRKLLTLSGGTGESQIVLMMGLILLAIVLKNAASYASSLTSAYLSQKLTNAVRKEGLKLLLEVDLDYYAKTKIGELINQLGGEVAKAAGAIRTAIQIGTTVITILVFSGLLLAISWPLTLVTTGLLLLVSLLNQVFIRRSKHYGELLTAKSQDYSIAVLEILSGIRLVKSISHERQEYQHLCALIEDREQAELDAQANFAIGGPVNEVAGIVTILVIVVVGRVLFSSQLEALSTILLTYLLILFRLLPVVSQLNGLRSAFANATPSVQMVYEFLRRDNKPFMASGLTPFTHLQTGIRFEDLTFNYPGHDHKVLNGITLNLPKGTTLALVGSSGAGKSTLADLLPRFYDVTGGSIQLDGKDLRDYDVRSLRCAMGIVSQDTFLFNTSIYHNIAYGCENVTPDDVISAAKRANAYEFIEKLPQGLETNIGDRGVLLSGGQRQRLAIARALLRDPEILILDEATSALDTVSERLVQQALEELSRNRTTLVIAHRLSTIQKADQIAVLRQGQVVEVGTHATLLQQGGEYARLHAMQFSERPSDGLQQDAMTKSTDELRSRLSAMLGSLRLVVDDLVDRPSDQPELTQDAYATAVGLLQELKTIEEGEKS
jgi:ATP-binding cassette, subfamily B, bacterial MsbA